MTSWKYYCEDLMVKTGYVTAAAVVGIDGGLWAKSTTMRDFSLLDAALIHDWATDKLKAGQKVMFAGREYIIDLVFDRSLYASLDGAYGGVVAVRTGKAIIVGLYAETIQSGRCINVLEKLADHLIGCGV